MYKRYESYKDSGIEWIGEIPEHWSTSKIKYQADINSKTLNEKTPEIFEIEYLDISNVDSDGKIIKMEPMLFRDAPSRARRVVSDGDTLVSTVRTYLKAITWLNKVENNLICSTGFAVLSPKKTIEPKYLSYLVRSPLYVEEIVSRSVGVSYPAITSTEIGNLECIMPPQNTNYINEQKTIANYLDKKTSEVDSLIADKEELIKKLEEYKQSIITEAVTKGLNPDVKMKDSGIEWIGEIPEHWEFIPLRWLINIKNGDSISRDEYIEKGIIPIYGGNGIISFTDKSNVNYKTIVMGRVGALCGNVHYVEHDKAWISDNAMYLSSWDNNKVSLKYLELIMRALKLNDYASKTAQPLITGETVKRQSIPLPPIDEQHKLINYIVKINKTNETLSADNSNQIQNLKKYRQSLIYEAVTGKIDVRDFQPERSEQLA